MGRRGRLCVTPSGETEYGIALPMIGLGETALAGQSLPAALLFPKAPVREPQ